MVWDDDADSIWTIEVYGDKVAIKGNNGKYLSRCNDCWPGAFYPDTAFVSATTPDAYSLWTANQGSNGKYTFRADNGNYLATCFRCAQSNGSSSLIAFVHAK
jgi:hypothetical protein